MGLDLAHLEVLAADLEEPQHGLCHERIGDLAGLVATDDEQVASVFASILGNVGNAGLFGALVFELSVGGREDRERACALGIGLGPQRVSDLIPGCAGAFKRVAVSPDAGERGAADDEGGDDRGENDPPALGRDGLAHVCSAGDQAPLLEDLAQENVLEEVGLFAVVFLAALEAVGIDTQRLGERDVEGLALAHRAGEVDASQEERLGAPFSGDEDLLQVLAQPRGDADHVAGELEELIDFIGAPTVGVGGMDGVLQKAGAALGELVADLIQVAFDFIGLEGVIERGRVAPAQDLVLEYRIGDALEKLAESDDLVALGDDDRDGEAHFEHPLNHIELTGDGRGGAIDLLGGILEQALGGDDQKQAVDGAVGPCRAEELEELGPF